MQFNVGGYPAFVFHLALWLNLSSEFRNI